MRESLGETKGKQSNIAVKYNINKLKDVETTTIYKTKINEQLEKSMKIEMAQFS